MRQWELSLCRSMYRCLLYPNTHTNLITFIISHNHFLTTDQQMKFNCFNIMPRWFFIFDFPRMLCGYLDMDIWRMEIDWRCWLPVSVSVWFSNRSNRHRQKLTSLGSGVRQEHWHWSSILAPQNHEALSENYSTHTRLMLSLQTIQSLVHEVFTKNNWYRISIMYIVCAKNFWVY